VVDCAQILLRVRVGVRQHLEQHVERLVSSV
jgi:hypothetical protein